jgi:hypothetical protein
MTQEPEKSNAPADFSELMSELDRAAVAVYADRPTVYVRRAEKCYDLNYLRHGGVDVPPEQREVIDHQYRHYQILPSDEQRLYVGSPRHDAFCNCF